MDPQAATQLILESLRLSIRDSGVTQLKIEEHIGFSRGYLSRVLGGKFELKLWRLLAILDVIDVEPADFFAAIYPRPGNQALEILERFRRNPTAQKPLSLDLARLYGFGIESVEEFRERLELCEDTLEELEAEDAATDPDRRS